MLFSAFFAQFKIIKQTKFAENFAQVSDANANFLIILDNFPALIASMNGSHIEVIYPVKLLCTGEAGFHGVNLYIILGQNTRVKLKEKYLNWPGNGRRGCNPPSPLYQGGEDNPLNPPPRQAEGETGPLEGGFCYLLSYLILLQFR